MIYEREKLKIIEDSICMNQILDVNICTTSFFLSRFRDFFLTNYVFLRGNMREERKRERERKTKENIINKQNPL